MDEEEGGRGEGDGGEGERREECGADDDESASKRVDANTNLITHYTAKTESRCFVLQASAFEKCDMIDSRHISRISNTIVSYSKWISQKRPGFIIAFRINLAWRRGDPACIFM